MKSISRFSLLPFACLVLAGCSSITTVATNPVSQTIKAPRVETVNKLVKLELAGRVTGYGCSDAEHFLDLGMGLNLGSKTDKAKAAAAYDALFGDLKDHPPVYHDQKFPFPNDLLIAPTYHYEIRDSLFDSELCAVASGYRAKVIAIVDSDTTTADPDPTSIDQNVSITVKTDEQGELKISEENYQILRDFLIRGKAAN